MKKVYEKPVIYSERLHIETLRAQCCNNPAALYAKQVGMLFGTMPKCKVCQCWELTGPS